MMSAAFDFQWEVNKDGYRWVQTSELGTNDERPFLTDSVPYGGHYSLQRYAPLRAHTGLFRNFAEITPGPEAVLMFANRFGFLGGDARTDNIKLPEGKTGIGELLQKWETEIYTMREALRLWDKAQAGDTEGLAQCIHWKGGDSVHYEYRQGDAKKTILIAGAHTPELLARFRPGDVIQPALHVVQRELNERLKKHISPRLMWDDEQSHLKLYMVPTGLIDALWLQFAQAVDGNKDYRRCEQCGTWFEVSRQAARKSRLFCSNACRSKTYRDKQAEAQRLHTKGVPLKDIARRLDTTIATARGWVEKGA